MSERGLPLVDGAPACPFVAFEDDRDERATSPDHRHRCYAEVRPAPRALAHQEAYCLASAFPVCPTFQDWARREAARARAADAAAGQPLEHDEPRRNPPRDWSAPPPWTGGSGGSADAAAGGAAAAAAGAGMSAGPGRDEEAAPPGFLASRDRAAEGLAGSRADRLAGPAGQAEAEPTRRDGGVAEPSENDADYDEYDGEYHDAEPADDDPASQRHDRAGGPLAALGIGGERRPRVGDTRPRRSEREMRGPSWERPQRYEAYPTIRTRMAMPALPRVGVLAAALVIAALALFFLPALLGVGEPDDGVGVASPTPSAAPSASQEATPAPVPTPQIYIVQSGDTMSRIASRFNVPLADLIAANRETVPDADRLDVGDEVIIPAVGSPPASPQETPAAS